MRDLVCTRSNTVLKCVFIFLIGKEPGPRITKVFYS